jgi:hypothetical protein
MERGNFKEMSSRKKRWEVIYTPFILYIVRKKINSHLLRKSKCDNLKYDFWL